MKTLQIFKKTGKVRRRSKLRFALILTLMAVAGSLNQVVAQRANFSDWNVPPPLPPGGLTKGNTTGKDARVTPVVLALADIPPVQIPLGQSVRLPKLAEVSTTASPVIPPTQPILLGGGAELPDIPLPDPPDASPLPVQSFQDSPFQQVIDLPFPVAPEMPPLPPEPKSSGQANGVYVPIPLIPGLVSLPFSSMPAADSFMIWSTPEIPESVSIEMVMPAVEKGIKGRGKSKQKVKSQSLKN